MLILILFNIVIHILLETTAKSLPIRHTPSLLQVTVLKEILGLKPEYTYPS